jgi:hypothetical protein
MYSKKPQLAIWGLSTSRAPLHAYDPPCMGSAGGRRLIHEVRFAQDSPLEKAVMSEPVSGGQFPGYWEKYRESEPNHDTSAF